MKYVLVIAGLLLSIQGGQAHNRSHHHAAQHTVHQLAVQQGNWSAGAGSSIISAMGRYMGGNPTGWRHNWCGEFMGMVARQVGITPPRNYALAAAWEHAGSPSGPEPGAIVVLRGGHHVGVVIDVEGTYVRVRSGNHGHRVADGMYPIRGAIFRRV